MTEIFWFLKVLEYSQLVHSNDDATRLRKSAVRSETDEKAIWYDLEHFENSKRSRSTNTQLHFGQFMQ